jgi:hypothetical protein
MWTDPFESLVRLLILDADIEAQIVIPCEPGQIPESCDNLVGFPQL